MGSEQAEEAGTTGEAGQANAADMCTSTSRQTASPEETALSGMPGSTGPPGMADLAQLAAPLGAVEAGPWPAPLHTMESADLPGAVEGFGTARRLGTGMRTAMAEEGCMAAPSAKSACTGTGDAGTQYADVHSTLPRTTGAGVRAAGPRQSHLCKQ